MDEYSIEDCDKKLHSMSPSNLKLLPSSVTASAVDAAGKNIVTTKTPANSSNWTMFCSNNSALRNLLPSLLQQQDVSRIAEDMPRIHSQVRKFGVFQMLFFNSVSHS